MGIESVPIFPLFIICSFVVSFLFLLIVWRERKK